MGSEYYKDKSLERVNKILGIDKNRKYNINNREVHGSFLNKLNTWDLEFLEKLVKDLFINNMKFVKSQENEEVKNGLD